MSEEEGAGVASPSLDPFPWFGCDEEECLLPVGDAGVLVGSLRPLVSLVGLPQNPALSLEDTVVWVGMGLMEGILILALPLS